MVLGSKGKSEDPFYNRKPVPDEFIKDIGYTGLTPQQEHDNRERKMSVNGVDLRKFSNSRTGGMEPQDDPYYGRKPVHNTELHGVGDTGLSTEEEYENRERKYSVNGVDVRRFSTSKTGGMEPLDDPYYGRKQVPGALTKGIGETGNTHAEDYEVRERKQSVVNFSDDPFQLISGQGHRQSISGGHVAAGAAAASSERRRSSAVAPEAAQAASATTPPHHGHFSGYTGSDKLEPIQSRTDGPEGGLLGGGVSQNSSGRPISGTTGVASNNGATSTEGGARGAANGGHTNFYDATTTGHSHGSHGLRSDDVAPDDVRA